MRGTRSEVQHDKRQYRTGALHNGFLHLILESGRLQADHLAQSLT